MEQVESQAAIDTLIAGFFSVFDNRNGLSPDLATLLGYFTDKAVIARVLGRDVRIETAMGFAVPRIELLTSGELVDFHEFETSSTTDISGRIANRTSRYRKTGVLNGDVYAGAGTKSFQLVCLESGWRILAFAWNDDEP